MVIGSLLAGFAGGAGVNIVIRAIDDFSTTFLKAKTQTGSLSKASFALAKAMSYATIAGVAVLGFGLVKATQKALIFEKRMKEVQTLMPKGTDAMKTFKMEVLKLSSTIPVMNGEIEVASGLYQTISAGITDSAEATQFLKVAMNAAIAGVSDTKIAVDGLTTVINAYGLEASEATNVSDILFTAIRNGKTTFNELAPAIGRVVAIAPSLGVGFEEVAASIVTLTKAGQSTDEAVTALRRAMISFAKPTEAMTNLIEKLGFESGLTLIQEKGFAEALRLVAQAGVDNNIPMTDLFQNIRALQAVLPLTGASAADFAAQLEAMGNSAGNAQKATDDMLQSSENQIQIFKNRFTASMTEIGEGVTLFIGNTLSATNAIALINIETTELEDSLKGFGLSMSEIDKIAAKLSNETFVTQEGRLNGLKLAYEQIKKKISETQQPMSLLNDFISLATFSYSDLTNGTSMQSDALLNQIKAIVPLTDELINFEQKLNNLIELNKAETIEEKQRILLTQQFTKLALDLNIAEEDRLRILGKINEITKETVISTRDLSAALVSLRSRGYMIGEDLPGGGSAFGGSPLINNAPAVGSGTPDDPFRAGDFLSRPGTQPVSFDKNDTIVGFKGNSPFGHSINVIIENIYGTDPDEMAEALEMKLKNMVSLG